MDNILPLEILMKEFVLNMKNRLFFQALANKFDDIKEKYGDDYPIILYEPAINDEENEILKDLIEGNNSVHFFTEVGEAFKFIQSLDISFILVVSKAFEEEHVLRNFESLQNTFGRTMFDFEEEALLKRVFTGISDEAIKSLKLKVYVFCTFFDCLTEAKIEDEEEVLLMCDIKDIAKEFRQEFIVIWYDPSVKAESKAKLEERIEVEIQEENVYKDFQELLARIKDDTGTPYHLILSGEIKSEAEELAKDIENLKNLLGLYIVCGDGNVQIGKNEKISIGESLEKLIPKIKEGLRTRSKPKSTFPAFATNFDSSDRTGIYKLHYYLKGLINFHNRKQAKEDFIKLARKIYQDQKKELVTFEEKYDKYNKAEILQWYTRDSPIYMLINNCLRISSSDSILYCRFVLRDLERAIREEYQEKSKDFNGEVYRGAFISTDEWEKLQRNIGEEIEMYGFLSTSVNQRVAMNFLKADPTNKILIKIIIPPLPELDEQGFADISEFSEFKAEKEILFNVRSRFRILEAEVTKIENREYKQLVLLYGAQTLRKYMTKTQPLIEIKLELPPQIKCDLCESFEKLFGSGQEKTSVICLECLIKGPIPTDTPMIALDAKDGGKVIKTLHGKILAPKEKISFANSGYKCHHCQAKGKNQYYKWMSCAGKNVFVHCSDCFKKNKKIENEILLSEGSPYTMWQEEQKKWETVSSDYQGILSRKIEDVNQGLVDLEVQNYYRCIEYGQKVVKKFKSQRRREVLKFNNFHVLGEALVSLGKYREALKYFEKCMGLAKFVGRENEFDGVRLYCKIAEIHYSLGEYQEALRHFQQVLHIKSENDEGTFTPYNGLALVYDRLGEHQKALECLTKAIDIRKSISGENNPHLATAYINLAIHYRNLGNYEEALEYSNKAHHIKKSIYGKKHSATAVSYGSLASIYHHIGKYDKAQKCYLKAIDTQKIIHGTNHPEIAASYNNLAGIYFRSGRHQEALEYFKKTNDIHKSIYGEKHSDTANSLNNIGSAYQIAGDLKEALKYFQMSLDLRKSIFGENHADVAASYNNIATVQEALGSSRAALENCQKALSIQKSIYPEHHPAISTSYNNIANAYDSLGDSQKAIRYYSDALFIQESVYGDKHPDTAMTYSNMGYSYDCLGDLEKAINCYNKAIEIQLAVYGKKSPEIATSYNNLGKVYEKKGEHLKALGYFQIALELQLSIYGENHISTLTTYNNIGIASENLGKYQEALELHKKVLDKRIVIFGEMHPDTAISYFGLASAHQNLGYHKQALEYYSKALDIRKSICGEKHTDTAASYDSLGSVCVDYQEYEMARKYYEKALSIEKSIRPEKHPTIATTYNNLGIAHYHLKNYQQALEYFSKALDLRESIFQGKHPDLASSYDSIGSVYCGLHEYQKALEYHVKSLKLRESILPQGHPDIAESFNKIGFLYHERGDGQNARNYFRKALDIFKALYKDEHPQTAGTYANLFAACQLLGKKEEASGYLKILIRNPSYAYLKKFTE